MARTTKVAIIALIILGLSASVIIYYPFYAQSYQAKYNQLIMVEADKLAEKPANYIHLEAPDPYVLEAISQQKIVVVAAGDTQIDDIIAQQGTNNFEINGNYYTIYAGGSVDVASPLSYVFLISLVALPISAIMLIATLAVKLAKKKKIN